MEDKIKLCKEQIYDLVPYVINRLNYILYLIKEHHIDRYDFIELQLKDRCNLAFGYDADLKELILRGRIIHDWGILERISINDMFYILDAKEINVGMFNNSKDKDIVFKFPDNIDDINPKDSKYNFHKG